MASKNIRNCGLRLLRDLRGVNLRGAIILGLKISFLERLYRLHLRIDNYKLRVIKGIKKEALGGLPPTILKILKFLILLLGFPF